MGTVDAGGKRHITHSTVTAVGGTDGSCQLWATKGPGRADVAWEQGQGEEQNRREGVNASAV